MVQTATDKAKDLIKEFVNFSANYLTLDFFEGITDEKLKRMEDFADKFLIIFNRLKTEKDFENFKKVYEILGINEKRIVLEFIGYSKNLKFSDFLFDIAKSNSFYSIDGIISLGQIGGHENISRLESLLDNSNDEVYSKVLRSVIHNLKKEAIASV